jgi:hypothetical protein
MMESLQKNRFRVMLFKALLGLANRLALLPNRLTPPPFRLLQIGSAFWLSRALYVATKLGLAEALGEREVSAPELAAELELDSDHLYRLLRMLAANGVFAESSPRIFRNSPMSHCLRADHPQSVRALILMHNDPVMTAPWNDSLDACIRDGETPFVRSHGVELYRYMDRDPVFDQLFSRAMDSVEALTGSDYLCDFDWSRFTRIVDVGGSLGSKTAAILRNNPQLRALVFDRPQVVEGATEYWRARNEQALLERMSFAGGDMFEAIPQAETDRDIYLCVGVFHGLGDEEVQKLLGKLKQAFGDKRPTLLAVDAVAAERNIDPAVAGFDMQMLIGTRGRERTLAEWTALFEGACLRIEEVVEVRTFASFIVVRMD